MVLFLGDMLRLALLSISVVIINENKLHNKLASQSSLLRSKTYDYIVIGGGAAGSTVAARLSEIEGIEVLLLEEGGPETVSTDIPAMDMMNLLLPTSFTNEFLIEPQLGAGLAFPSRQFSLITGRVLGGGTSIGGLIYDRGGKNDYDGWATDYQAKGWGYEDVLPLFKKSEDQQDQRFRSGQQQGGSETNRYHGTGGPLTINSPSLEGASGPYKLLTETFMTAANQLGYQSTDLNGENQVGAVVPQRILKNGRRLSASTAYLRPASERPNLHILTRSRATKIIFNEKNATGVEFLYRGYKVEVAARKEVIVSAGAVGSPKLLLLSGLGPKEDLENLGIPLVADLPVGKNFHDHVRVFGLDFTVNQTLFTFWQDLPTFDNLANFYQNGQGPLASNFYLEQGALLNIKTSMPTGGSLFGPSDVRIQPCILPSPLLLGEGVKGGVVMREDLMKNEIMKKYYSPYLFQSTLNLCLTLNHVKSRGSLSLRSKDPLVPPIIDPAYLRAREDVDRLVEAYRVAMKLGESPAFQKLSAQPFDVPVPGCEIYLPVKSTAYIECKIRHFSMGQGQPSGGCKMTGGGNNDTTAVVDERLKVRGGVKGLRVVDSSIMPSAVSGNLMAATIMIGEKASDMIIEDLKRKE